MIQSAIEQQNDGVVTGYSVTLDNGKTFSVPVAEGNRHYRELMDWVEQGNIIAPQYTQDELNQQARNNRIAELKQLLVESDYKVLPDYDKTADDIKVMRQDWREEIRELTTIIEA